MFWRGKYFIDLALPVGLRSAPGIFNSVADLFHWLLVNNSDVKDLLHYLDDYFTLGSAGSTLCADRLGIPLSPEKCEGPSTCLVFLGIELGSIAMTARLPEQNRLETVRCCVSGEGKSGVLN